MALAGLADESMCGAPGGGSSTSAGAWSGRQLLPASSRRWSGRHPARGHGPVYETLLIASESLVAYRRRFRSDLELDALCDLLLADDTNPRSLAFQSTAWARTWPSCPTAASRQTAPLVDEATGSCSGRPGSMRRTTAAAASDPHLGHLMWRRRAPLCSS